VTLYLMDVYAQVKIYVNLPNYLAYAIYTKTYFGLAAGNWNSFIINLGRSTLLILSV